MVRQCSTTVYVLISHSVFWQQIQWLEEYPTTCVLICLQLKLCEVLVSYNLCLDLLQLLSVRWALYITCYCLRRLTSPVNPNNRCYTDYFSAFLTFAALFAARWTAIILVFIIVHNCNYIDEPVTHCNSDTMCNTLISHPL